MKKTRLAAAFVDGFIRLLQQKIAAKTFVEGPGRGRAAKCITSNYYYTF